MTTILAIMAAFIFYGQGYVLLLVITIIAGVVQAWTKGRMNDQAKYALARGETTQSAVDSISDELTHVNMVASFVIWGLFAYSIYATFG